jgi:hypothetical protein
VLTGEELWQVMSQSLLLVAMVDRTIRDHRRSRQAGVLKMLGLPLCGLKRQARARHAVAMFALGSCVQAARRRLVKRLAPVLLCAGMFVGLGRESNAAGLAEEKLQSKKRAKEAKARAKAEAKAASSRRFVRWQSIEQSSISAQSMWAQETEDVAVDAAALASQEEAIVAEFTIRKKALGVDEAGAAKAKPAGPRVVSQLDAKERQTAELVLSMILKKLSIDEVRQAINDLDIEGLGGNEVAQRLLRAEACFDAPVIRNINEAVLQPGEQRSIADDFAAGVVGTTPLAKERLQFMAFEPVFEDLFDRAFGLIDQFRGCVREVSASSKYRLLLTRVVLPLGNKLRGIESAAFRVTDLPKLHATKNSQGTTFLQVVVRFCMENCPLLIDLDDEFDMCSSISLSRLSIQDIVSSFRECEREVKPLQALSAKGNEAGMPDALQARVAHNLRSAESRVQSLRSDLDNLQEEFSDLCEYLAEDEASITPKEIFTAIKTFLADLNKTIQGEERRKQARERAEAKARAQANPAASQTRAPSPAKADRRAASASHNPALGAEPAEEPSDAGADEQHTNDDADAIVDDFASPDDPEGPAAAALAESGGSSRESSHSYSIAHAVGSPNALGVVRETDDAEDDPDSDVASDRSVSLTVTSGNDQDRPPLQRRREAALLHHEALTAMASPIQLGAVSRAGDAGGRRGRRASMMVSLSAVGLGAAASARESSRASGLTRRATSASSSRSPNSRKLSRRATLLAGSGSGAALLGLSGAGDTELKALDSAIELWTSKRVHQSQPSSEAGSRLAGKLRRATLALH